MLHEKSIFNQELSEFKSNIGAGNKYIKVKRKQWHIRFTKVFDSLSNSSKDFFYKRSLVYNSRYDFPKIFHFFSYHFRDIVFPLNNDTQMISEYIKLWCTKKIKNIDSFHELESLGIKGYLKLLLQPITTHKKL